MMDWLKVQTEKSKFISGKLSLRLDMLLRMRDRRWPQIPSRPRPKPRPRPQL